MIMEPLFFSLQLHLNITYLQTEISVDGAVANHQAFISWCSQPCGMCRIDLGFLFFFPLRLLKKNRMTSATGRGKQNPLRRVKVTVL